jgi:hypothetical protein
MARVAMAVSIGVGARSTPRLRHTRFLAAMVSPSHQKRVAREDGPRNTRQGVKEGQGPHPTDFFCSGLRPTEIIGQRLLFRGVPCWIRGIDRLIASSRRSVAA